SGFASAVFFFVSLPGTEEVERFEEERRGAGLRASADRGWSDAAAFVLDGGVSADGAGLSPTLGAVEGDAAAGRGSPVCPQRSAYKAPAATTTVIAHAKTNRTPALLLDFALGASAGSCGVDAACAATALCAAAIVAGPIVGAFGSLAGT